MLSRLDSAFDGQRRLVANASHELKTPLVINRTLIEVALGRPDSPPEVARLGETLLEVNSRHERDIDGLLTLARSQHTVVDPVLFDPPDVVSRVVDNIRPEAERSGVLLPLAGAYQVPLDELVGAPEVGDPPGAAGTAQDAGWHRGGADP